MNVLLNLVKPNVDDYVIDEIYLYANYEKKNINILIENTKRLALNTIKIQRLLFNIHIICRIFISDVITDMFSTKRN